MPKPMAQFVHCLQCTRGRNGERSCAAAGNRKENGCFLGEWIRGQEPRIVNGEAVHIVESPTLGEALAIAQAQGFKEWIHRIPVTN